MGKIVNLEKISKYSLIFAAIMFAIPLVLAILYQSGFIKLANENLACRYFFHNRMAQGEAVFVGVGYLTTLLQKPIYFIINALPGMKSSSLFLRLNAFSILTIMTVVGAMISILLHCYHNKSLLTSDRFLIALFALLPLYGSKYVGLEFYLEAEYYLVDMVIYVLILYIFLCEWRSSATFSWLRSGAWAALVGVFAANRITLLVVASSILWPTIIYFKD